MRVPPDSGSSPDLIEQAVLQKAYGGNSVPGPPVACLLVSAWNAPPRPTRNGRTEWRQGEEH